jgi:hypothetical protein
MITLYQADKLFREKATLKNLHHRVQSALTSQEHELTLLNQQQDLCCIQEINWENAVCFIRVEKTSMSLPLIKQFIKGLLIEHYGEKAMRVKIVLQENYHHNP